MRWNSGQEFAPVLGQVADDAAIVEKGAQVPDLWFHDLRRSFITRARKLGIPESVVMRMSGHRTRAVFDRYNVVSVDDQSAAVGRLDESWTRFGHFSETGVQTKYEDLG